MAFSSQEIIYIKELIGMLNRLGTDKFVDWLGVLHEIQKAIDANDVVALKNAMAKIQSVTQSMSGDMLEMENLKKAVEAILREMG